MASSPLMDLPPELVTSIASFTDPAGLVQFACSCTYFNECSRDVLDAHRKAHDEYRVVTDIQPRTIPDLLRKVILDPTLAWHIREVEFCYGRTDWARWKKFEFEIEESSRGRGKPPPPTYAFTRDERAMFLNMFRSFFLFSEQDIDKVREDMMAGNDAPLKLLLFAFCPGIRSLKFSRHLQISGRDAFDHDRATNMRAGPRSSLDYIQKAIRLHEQNGHSAWPVGFESLRFLGVGVDTGTEIDELEVRSPPHVFADFMRLPGLGSIYFYGLHQISSGWQMDDTDDGCDIEEDSSLVQSIFLDHADGISWDCKKAITGGCKDLKSFTITNSEIDDMDMFVGNAGCDREGSLETLMFYETERLHGYRCNMYRPEAFSDSNNLRMLYADSSDVMLDAFYNYDGDANCGENHEWIGDLDHFVDFFMNAFPKSVEVLVLGSMSRYSNMLEGDAGFMDQAVAKMIEYGRNDEGKKEYNGGYPHLKAVYLGGLDEIHNDARLQEAPKPPRQKRWFSRAIEAGHQFGVDVHTRTTRGRSFHQIDFPKPPSIADLKSAPEPPEEPLVFDVYTGIWGPEKCGNCGRCEECLEQYDACVWREVDKEMEKEG